MEINLFYPRVHGKSINKMLLHKNQFMIHYFKAQLFNAFYKHFYELLIYLLERPFEDVTCLCNDQYK